MRLTNANDWSGAGNLQDAYAYGNVVSTADIDNAANTYTDAGGNPVFSNPFTGPSVSSQMSNAIAAGATPQSYASQFPGQPLTPSSLVTPIPDITGLPYPGTVPVTPDPWCSTSQWISENPIIAVAALATLFFLVRR